VGDFTGTLTASTTTVAAGDTMTLHLTIRNVTDHTIDLSSDLDTTFLGLNCDIDYAGSHGRVGAYYSGWTFAERAIDPGATRELVTNWTPTSNAVGAMYCSAVIVDVADTPVRFFPGFAAVRAIPSVEITVLPNPDSTTTTSSTSTTVPGSTSVPTS
jgi:hypothetical protein